MGDLLLNADAAWVAVGRAAERPRQLVGAAGAVLGVRPDRGPLADGPVNERRLANVLVAQFPWEWSAGVLAGLLGLSTCILTLRVKSLDRLK